MKPKIIIYCLFSALKPFYHNKIPPEKKIKATEVYLQDLSYRQVTEILGNSSKTRKTIYQPKLLTIKKQRNFIAVDETAIKINGEKRIPLSYH